MARANAAMSMMPPPMAPQPPMKMAKASAKQPHGMSLAAKPQRTPHPTAKGRDIHGRLMPGATLPGAAPPFQMRNIPNYAPSMPPKGAPMPLAPKAGKTTQGY